MTTTDEQIISENSETQNKSLENVADKSSEPETINDEAVTPTKTFQNIDVPEKFKNKDGSANLCALVKSYKELEPLINEKATWEKEKTTLAQEKEDLQKKIVQYEQKNTAENHKLNSISVKLYEKMLDKSSDKEKAQTLINSLNETVSEEDLSKLEKLFPIETVKEIAQQSIIANNLEFQKEEEQAKQEEFDKTKTYLKEVVEKNYEELKNPVTAGIFSEVFQHFGTDLDSDWFFEKINDLKTAFILKYQQEQNLKKEIEDATTVASKISSTNNSNKGTPLSQRNACKIVKIMI